MKNKFAPLFSAVFGLICLIGLSACDNVPEGEAVSLVAVTAAEVGVRNDIDYFVIPEPAASTKANTIADLNLDRKSVV